MSRSGFFLPSLFLLILQFLCSPVFGEEFPSPAQIPARAGEVAAEAIHAQSRIEALSDTTPLAGQVELAETRFRQLQERIELQGDPVGWSLERLLETRSVLQSERTRLQRLQQNLTDRQEEIETIRRSWEDRALFWRNWEESLVRENVQFPRESLAQGREAVSRVLTSAQTIMEPLAALQGESASLLNENLGLLVQVDAALRRLRGQIFQRTGHPLLHPEFSKQFGEELREEVRFGVREALRLDLQTFQGQIWIVVAQLLIVFASATFILRHRRSAPESKEWDFILSHPWATGIFVAMAALAPFYATLAPLLNLVLWFFFAFSAAILISALVRNPVKRFTVYLLAAVLLTSMVLQLISLPAPMYRLYIAAVSLAGIPLALLLARYNIRRHEGKVAFFSMGLRLGALVCLISFLAQAAGYGTLSARLIDASIKAVFIGIFALMTMRLGQGGIDYILTHPIVSQRTFVQRFGGELARRLKSIFKVFVGAGAFYHILVVMGVYHTFGQAWDDLTGLGVSIGQVHLTVAMILLSLLVIYLSIQVSWVLRAALDTQVFPYSAVDRGVSDAIKKLLHYFLVLIGFLLAMSLAGLELRNFAVLAGAFGIGIGFGLQNIVNNFVSGLILLFERPIKVGDMVVVGGDWGRGGAIGLRSTVIVTLDGSELIVPNSDLISERVTNWTLTTTRARVVIPVGVAYGSNLELVLQILQEAAESHPLVLSEPAPSPIFIGFGDSSLDFELRSWIADVSSRLTVRSELGQFIDRRFREEGVEIPFPQRDLHLRSVDGEIFARARQSNTSS